MVKKKTNLVNVVCERPLIESDDRKTATPRKIQTLVLRMQCKQGSIAQGIVAYHPNGLTCIAHAHRTSPLPPPPPPPSLHTVSFD